MTYSVVETFVSINGEGYRVGQLALFIRFRGCNLNCAYCDTQWANEKDCPALEMTLEDILETIRASGVKNVTLTGGEPLLRHGMAELLTAIGELEGVSCEIETNGSVPVKPFLTIPNRPSFTMDYKLSASGMEKKMCRENFSLLEGKDTVKFVCGSREDLERAVEVIEEYKLIETCHVYLSPVFGMIEPADMVEFMKERHLNGVNLQIQMHKVIWPPEMRGV